MRGNIGADPRYIFNYNWPDTQAESGSVTLLQGVDKTA